jgi:hypothetical protein
LKPFANRVDNFLAACLNALLSIVILISVLLKMDTASLLGHTRDDFDAETAAVLLVSCNVLVVVVSVAAYWISVRQAGRKLAAIDEGWEVLRQVDHGVELAEPATPFRRMADDTADGE